tara:strand:- start:2470 stop:3387 length:918 start_codon:yes stop_codon:yes gene_type:complete
MTNQQNQGFEDEIDLRELFEVLWTNKVRIIVITGLVSLSSIVISLMMTNYYTSESVLIARDQQDSGALSDFSGVASLVGVDLSGDGASVFKVLEIIQSREFTKHLITFDNILPSIMAAESYDTSSKKIIFDPEIYDEESKTWTREPSANGNVIPSHLEAHREYSDMLSIMKDKITGLISIKIEHVSPVFAHEFLSLIIQEANNLNREIDVATTTKALAYLKTELSQTPQVEIKKSISKLIENQLETKMMASIYDDYVLIALEPPFVPDKKSGPIRSLIVIVSTLLAGIFSLLYVLIRHYFSDRQV